MKPVYPLALCFSLLASHAQAANLVGRLVDQKTNKGVGGGVVYIKSAPGKFKPQGKPVMNQIDKEFFPNVVAVLAGGEVEFKNGDDVKHEIYSFSPVKKFELPLFGKGEKSKSIKFDKPGVVNVGCNIHDWMSGAIVVVQNPFFDTTGGDGSFAITGVPAGTYEVTFYHPGGKPATQKVTLPLKGKFELKSMFRPIVKKPRPEGGGGDSGRY